MNSTPQRLLAIDTSGPGAGLALWGDGRTGTAGLVEGGVARTEFLAEKTVALLHERGWSPSDLTLLGAVVGPGSYTGLRSGLAFVRGLALARDLPVVAVGSLELLAWSSAASGETVLSLWPLGSGRWAVGAFAREEDEARSFFDAVAAGEEELEGLLHGALPAPSAVVVPAGIETPSVPAALVRCEVRQAGPGALAALADLVLRKARRGLAQSADGVMPLYVGQSSAKPNRARVAVAAGPL